MSARRLTGRGTRRVGAAAGRAADSGGARDRCHPVTVLDDWAGALARRLTTIAGLLSAVTGLTGPILGVAAPELLAQNKEDLKHLHESLSHLKVTAAAAGDRYTASDVPLDRASSEADARKIEEILRSVDPHRHWGGLTKTVTPGGLTLFLCEDHARAYTAASPRPRGI